MLVFFGVSRERIDGDRQPPKGGLVGGRSIPGGIVTFGKLEKSPLIFVHRSDTSSLMKKTSCCSIFSSQSFVTVVESRGFTYYVFLRSGWFCFAPKVEPFRVSILQLICNFRKL